MDTCIPINYPSICDIFIKQKFKQKIISRVGALYSILNYDKNIICFDDFNSRLFRSVIFTFPEKQLLCFAPPQSIPYKTFIDKYPQPTDVVVHEKIEGTMINLFYDFRTKQWEMATKSSIGGRNRFTPRNTSHSVDCKYSPTYYEMFMDALCIDRTTNFNEVEFIKQLPYKIKSDKEEDFISYSFVLQHPENNIYVPSTRPTLYLVAAYVIKQSAITYISTNECKSWEIFQSSSSMIAFPKEYALDTTCVDIEEPVEPTECELNYDKLLQQCSCQQNESTFCGLVLTDILTGDRTNIKNPSYDTLKLECANNQEMLYKYLWLSRLDCIHEYIRFFPKSNKIFCNYREQYIRFISCVHNSYILKYVWKSDRQISERYQSHIYKIHHTIYLASLMKNREHITFKIVKEYFDSMLPYELLYILNSNSRAVMG